MNGSTEVIKGRIEEAAGVLIGNDNLRAKGLKDQAVGRIIQNAETEMSEIKKTAGHVVEKAKKAVKHVAKKAKSSI